MEALTHSAGSQVHVLLHLGDSVHWSRGEKAPGTTLLCTVVQDTLHGSMATIHIKDVRDVHIYYDIAPTG